MLRVHASTTVRAFTGTLYVVKVKLCLVLILDWKNPMTDLAKKLLMLIRPREKRDPFGLGVVSSEETGNAAEVNPASREGGTERID